MRKNSFTWPLPPWRGHPPRKEDNHEPSHPHHQPPVWQRRAAYYRFYTDQKWGQAENFDLTLNTGSIGLDQCAAVIAQLYETKRANHHPPAPPFPGAEG